MKKFILLSLLVFLSACSSASTTLTTPTSVASMRVTDVPTSTPVVPTQTQAPNSTSNVEKITPTAWPTLAPNEWKTLSAVPLKTSQRVEDIFVKGQSLGNRPDVFIKIGDSNSTTSWFLGPLGRGECSLGEEYADLSPAIDAFKESFLRNSVSVGRGFNTSSALSPFWADREQCKPGETPLDCEIRIMQPAYALVMLGTNDVTSLEQFEPNMRVIIETLIDAGVIPILSTKVDNLEGDHEVNATIARLAYEYQIPLWNLWKALEPLKNHGAQWNDEAHLTYAGCSFDDPYTMQTGSAWRNLTALQVIDKVWRDVKP